MNPTIRPAHCDTTKVFEFINEVQTDKPGIWVDVFDDVTDIAKRLASIENMAKPLGGLAIVREDTPTQQNARSASLRSMSAQAAGFVTAILGEREPSTVLSAEELERCVRELKDHDGRYGIYPSEFLGDAGLWGVMPLRPAEDDGSSWYGWEWLSVDGQLVLRELTSFMHQ